MSLALGLGVAGLATGILGSLSASRDAAAQAEAQYNWSQYQTRRATDAANIQRAYNFRNQVEQQEALFEASYEQYYLNQNQAKDRYSQQVGDISAVYMKTRGALESQMERNGLTAQSGSGRAIAYSAMRQASKQLQGVSANLADQQYQNRSRLDTALSTKVNAEAPALFIQGAPPQTASSMTNLLGAVSGGLGGLSAGLSTAQAFQDAFPSTIAPSPATLNPGGGNLAGTVSTGIPGVPALYGYSYGQSQ